MLDMKSRYMKCFLSIIISSVTNLTVTLHDLTWSAIILLSKVGLLLFWSFLLLSLFSLKREDSCSKSLHLSCKMTIFNLSLFFLKFLCRSILRDWDQDFWAIIFEWILFYGMTIGRTYTFFNFALEGGGAGKFWITLYCPRIFIR